MKILLVSEDEDVSLSIANAVRMAGKDVIIYRYLLKALDNIEEISPDAVIINAVDYPRHWKVLVSYISCMNFNPVAALYIPRSFDEDDDREANALGISLTFCSIDDSDALLHTVQDVIRKASSAPNSPASNNGGHEIENIAESKRIAKSKEKAGDNAEDEMPSLANGFSLAACFSPLIFTHPETGAFITGKVKSFDGDNAMFAPDKYDMVKTLCAGDAIKEVSYKKDNIMYSCKASVCAIDHDNKTLSLRFE